jgi:transcriptional pleiotropic regulator of transition state genes
MKATGIVRKVDDLGRVCLPKSLRKALNENSTETLYLEIFTDDTGIILKKYGNKCIFCSETDRNKLTRFKGQYVCDNCRKGVR